MEEKPIGKITHFFGKISVAVVELSDKVKQGDKLHIKGMHSDFEQTIDSMQINHQAVPEAKAGESIGLKVKEMVHEGDQVFRVQEEASEPPAKPAAKPAKPAVKPKPKQPAVKPKPAKKKAAKK